MRLACHDLEDGNMALIQVNYMSKALSRTVPVNVLLPVDKFDSGEKEYVMDGNHRYKTLYLLHGFYGNYTDWVSRTRIQEWAEEKELAVVMPSGDNAFYVNSMIPRNDYETFIGEELPEITRKMFPLSDKREDTYIMGFSMGGFGALRNGMVFSDRFSHVIGLSAALSVFNNLGGTLKTMFDLKITAREMFEGEREVPNFYMACGTQDDLFEINTDFRDFLRENGADVEWDEEDEGHNWSFCDSQIKKVLDWLPL